MYNGNELWDSSITNSLKPINVHNSTYHIYSDLPDSLYSMLKATAERLPNKTAVVDYDNSSYTYKELLTAVDNFALYLSSNYKIEDNSQVAIMLYNSMNFYISFIALSKLGAIPVMLPTKFKETEVLSLLEKVELSLIICEDDFSSWFNKLDIHIINSDNRPASFNFLTIDATKTCNYKERSFEHPALIMFTSGTTSQSKAVELSTLNIMHAIVTYQKIFKISQTDRTLISTPIYHITGTVALLGLFVYSGGTAYLHKFFKANDVLQSVIDNEINFIHASPAVFSLLLDESSKFPKLPTLKTLLCGSGIMPVYKLQQIKKWLPQVSFHTVYGLTETSSPATIFPCDACTSEYIGSAGKPIPGSLFKIVNEDGLELDPTLDGEILIKGSTVLTRYYNTKTNSLDNEKWLHTGDIGHFNEEGYLFISGRNKDMINRGGEKIWCTDVEKEIYTMQGIEEAVVVGIPHATLGEIPVVLIKLQQNCKYTEDEVRAYLKNRIASFKIPEKVKFTESIPLTPNMKIDKKTIKLLFQGESI